jgi:hypothetical protein
LKSGSLRSLAVLTPAPFLSSVQFTWINDSDEEEAVWKYKGSLHRHDPVYDYYIQSKLEWMLVEVNLLWRRNYRGDDGRIPFYCRHCGVTMKNKHYLGHHRKRNQCLEYIVLPKDPLKMFPILSSSITQGVLREVFKSLSLPLPVACGGKRTEEDDLEEEVPEVDLEEDPVCKFQEPIVISEEDDFDFDDDSVPLVKRRRFQHVREPKSHNSFGGRAQSSAHDATSAKQPTGELDRKGKWLIAGPKEPTVVLGGCFTACDSSI